VQKKTKPLMAEIRWWVIQPIKIHALFKVDLQQASDGHMVDEGFVRDEGYLEATESNLLIGER
jgi:hypothetical protein